MPPITKNAPIKKTSSNSTNKFAPNCPKLGKKLPPIGKKMLPIKKKKISNSTHTFAPNLKKCPQLNKNLPTFKKFASISFKFVNPKWD